MTKVFFLILLTLTSNSLCSRNSLQFLTEGSKQTKGMTETLKAFVERLGIFHDIQVPEGCTITDDESEGVLFIPLTFGLIVSGLVTNWDFESAEKDFKSYFNPTYELYSVLYPKCESIAPIVSERVHKVVQYMYSLEYIAKASSRVIAESGRFWKMFFEVMDVCKIKSSLKEHQLCGKRFGELVRDLFLWDYKQ
jgi:hypothetical protein